VGLRPQEADARAALVAEIEAVVKRHCPGATVATFGSMTASLGACARV
jgi:DNA polymerase sigma